MTPGCSWSSRRTTRRSSRPARQPVRLEGLTVAAQLLVGADGGRWHAQTKDLQIHREGMRVAVNGMVAGSAPEDAGRVDAHVELAETDAVMLASLLGARAGSAFGIDAGKVSGGRITSGTFELHGPLYVDPALARTGGEFHGTLELREVSLAGDEAWPPVQELSAHLDWRADRADAAISHARSGSFQLSKARLQWDPRPQGAVHFAGLLSRAGAGGGAVAARSPGPGPLCPERCRASSSPARPCWMWT